MAVARTLVIDREKMADEPMHRPVRGHGQPHPQPAVDNPRARRGEDPLAELARLIGQEDPFAEFSGSSAQRRPSVSGTNSRYSRPVTVQPERRPDRQANGAYAREREADHAPTRQADPRYQSQRPTQQPTRSYEERAPQREQDRYQPRTRTPQARGNGASYDYDQYEQPPARPRTNGRADAGYATRSRDPYADEAPRQSRSAYAEDPRTARRADRYQPEEPRHARGRQQQAYQEPYNRGYEDDYDPDYADDAYLPEHADDIYGEVPRPRRSWGLYLVVGIVAVSLVAVAFLGVFAYRTIFNTPPRPAQVTKSNAPTKVDPKNSPQNAAAPNKTIQDRIGATGPEQVIPREEQPADLTQQPNQQRALQFNQPPQQQAPQQVQRPQQKGPAFAPPPTQQQATNPDQPKKVRTFTVRSDGTVTPNSNPQQQQAPQGPLPLNANPNSLEPETNVAPPTPRPNSNLQNNPPRQQQAAVAPSIAPSTGNYVVQVASHKTQEEAQAAWNNLRNQYASIFGSRNADIRRVDLGDRGTFYRAMVGPMGRDQANALCQNLKTAGAGCIVQTR